MTPETQALVERLEQDAGILEQHGGFPTVVAEVRDAAAALSSLSRDLETARTYIKTCEAVLREHAEAASIFQPGGRFHARADLLLGRSAVVDGIAWLVAQLDRAEADLETARQERDAALKQRNAFDRECKRLRAAAREEQ